MVRKYVRKTSNGSWQAEEMEKAVQAVLGGTMGYRMASKTFGIPQTTLERRVKLARKIANVEVPGASTSTSTLQLAGSSPAIEHVHVKEEAIEAEFEQGDDPSWFEVTDNFKTELADDQYPSDDSGTPEIPVDNPEPVLKKPRLGSFAGSQIPIEQRESDKEIKETEFDMFGRSIGTQLNNMPLRDALELQLALQKVITDYRLSKFAT